MPYTLDFGEKQVEQALSQMGGKVVDAIEKIFSAKASTEEATLLLMDIQIEIADLYERLGDFPALQENENL